MGGQLLEGGFRPAAVSRCVDPVSAPSVRCGRRSWCFSPSRSLFRCCRGFGCDLLWFFAMPYDHRTRPLFWPARISVPSSPVRSLDVQPTASSKATLIDAQSMADREMAFEHLAVPATIEADDIIAMNGLPDRDGRCPRGSTYRHSFSTEFVPGFEDSSRPKLWVPVNN